MLFQFAIGFGIIYGALVFAITMDILGVDDVFGCQNPFYEGFDKSLSRWFNAWDKRHILAAKTFRKYMINRFLYYVLKVLSIFFVFAIVALTFPWKFAKFIYTLYKDWLSEQKSMWMYTRDLGDTKNENDSVG